MQIGLLSLILNYNVCFSFDHTLLYNNITFTGKTGAIHQGAQYKSLSKGDQDRNQRIGKIGWQARGGPQRDIDVLMELQLSKVKSKIFLFAPI